MKAKWIWILVGILVLAAVLIRWRVVFSMDSKNDPAETVTFEAADGLPVTGDLYFTGDAQAPFLLLCHQAGYSRGEYREIAPRLGRMGYNCLAIDQRSGRGYNDVPNETAAAAKKAGLPVRYTDAYPDLEAALRYIAGEYQPSRLIVWGSSYSASLALILAAEHPAEVQAVLAYSPGEYFSFNDKRVSDYAGEITQPVFITSAKSEKQAWRGIADSISTAGSVFFVPEGSGVHGSSALMESTKNNAEYWTAVESFLQSLN